MLLEVRWNSPGPPLDVQAGHANGGQALACEELDQYFSAEAAGLADEAAAVTGVAVDLASTAGSGADQARPPASGNTVSRAADPAAVAHALPSFPRKFSPMDGMRDAAAGVRGQPPVPPSAASVVARENPSADRVVRSRPWPSPGSATRTWGRRGRTPVERAWALLKRSLANLVKRSLAKLTALVKTGSGECSTGLDCSAPSWHGPGSTSRSSVTPGIEDRSQVESLEAAWNRCFLGLRKCNLSWPPVPIARCSAIANPI
jgi:hypothetical protein